MGKMKELFISMQEGLMQGIAITNAQRERQFYEENKYMCGSCGEHCNEYTYNEETDVDECNECKTINQTNESKQ
tara:strand:+ start:309 stop:530 length:222 start_codon:yes stop_codon:yes gene_type:complete